MIEVSHPSGIIKGEVLLPASKSISNRLLVLRALYDPDLHIGNLAGVNDTKVMLACLANHSDDVNTADAGTVMRFLTAYYACSNRSITLSGTHRMHLRPIKELVEELQKAGASISYVQKSGYPPIHISGSSLNANEIALGQVSSSQFISAILMILPKINGEAKLVYDPGMNSVEFVELTIKLMEIMGFTFAKQDGEIQVLDYERQLDAIEVEADWTSFYYWYAAALLSKQADLFFPGLSMNGIQAESRWLTQLIHPLVQVTQEKDGVRLQRAFGPIHWDVLKLNFSDFPDLAPTFLPLLSLLCPHVEAEGLEFLPYKESNRMEAIQQVLKDLGGTCTVQSNLWTFSLDPGNTYKLRSVLTHDDHRLAMSALPFALLGPTQIEQQDVVAKSYPLFWRATEHLGFVIKELV